MALTISTERVKQNVVADLPRGEFVYDYFYHALHKDVATDV